MLHIQLNLFFLVYVAPQGLVTNYGEGRGQVTLTPMKGGGGGGQSFSHAGVGGGQKKFWGSFSAEALIISHNEGGAKSFTLC